MRTNSVLVLLVSSLALTLSACNSGDSVSEAGVEGSDDWRTAKGIAGESDPDKEVTYTVYDEKIYDAPIKTQIEQKIVVHGVPSSGGLRREILRRFSSAKSRRGFKYHDRPTNIYIYVFGSEEQAAAGQGLWIGMIAMVPLDRKTPRVEISESRLQALSSPPEDRFGLSENERKVVFREIVAAEERATQDAVERVPNSRIKEQVSLESDLGHQYKLDLAKKYGLSEEQLQAIGLEGIEKGWPWS